MCTYPNPYYSYPYYTPYGAQPTPIEPLPLPSLSTTALQDIVEGQQRATTGLVTLLSQERTSNERGTRDNKQQLTNLLTLSQNFLGYLPDVEQKFSALENSIPINSTNADNAGLQDRLNDMEQAIVNLRRIAESFASSTGLRLVPGPALNQWSWVPASTPVQQDYASFASTFPQAPHIFPTNIPYSTRSSVFAHSNPARSVHWPSNLDTPPATSSATPWLDTYSSSPYGAGNPPSAFSRISLGGVRGFSGVPSCMTPPSDPSSPPTPMASRFGPCSPAPSPQLQSGRRSFPFAIPIEISVSPVIDSTRFDSVSDRVCCGLLVSHPTLSY